MKIQKKLKNGLIGIEYNQKIKMKKAHLSGGIFKIEVIMAIQGLDQMIIQEF